MSIIERDVVNQSVDENGNLTIDFPLARLGWIEDTADIKTAPGENDFIPIVDGDDNGQMKKVPVGVLASSTAKQYSASATYAVGEYCNYGGKLYICTTAITTAEAWNTAHWMETSIEEELEAARTAAEKAQETANEVSKALSDMNSTINTVPSQSGVLAYTGASQSPTWNGYDTEKLTIGGTTSGINAGTYAATFTPKKDFKWADGTTAAKTVNWSIGKAVIAKIPTQADSLSYSGSTQSPTWSAYNTSQLTIGGTTSAIDAGDYTATFTPTANYKWSDGTTTAKSAEWSIDRIPGMLTINKTSLALTSGTLTGTITVSRVGDGAITATSSNTTVATVSVSGTTVTVTGKVNGAATITINAGIGTNHFAAPSKTCAVTVEVPRIYGVSWDGTSTTKWTRTDGAAGFKDPVPYVSGASAYSSPFDNLAPWKGMVKSERTGGTMVAIPKFWYKLTDVGAGMRIQIADKAAAGFSVSPAHIDRGDGKGERDVVYIGRYHCGASAYKSATGQMPKNNITRATARSEIHKLGSTIWQSDFLMRFTIWLLYIVEFADWNSQKTIGLGCGNGNGIQTMGYTDSMPYHTGTTQASRDTFGLGTQYRNIEGLWDNVYDWTDGCYNNSSGLNIVKNPNSFSDTSGGTSIGIPSNGWPSDFKVSSAMGVPMFTPNGASGSSETYSCDVWYFVASFPCVYVGGSYSRGTNYGLFCVDYDSVSSSSSSFGSRLQELP